MFAILTFKQDLCPQGKVEIFLAFFLIALMNLVAVLGFKTAVIWGGRCEAVACSRWKSSATHNELLAPFH